MKEEAQQVISMTYATQNYSLNQPARSHKDAALDLIEDEIPTLRRFARSLTRDRDQADDLVQDCLLRAIENIEKWQPGTSMRAWLIVMLRNLFYNKMRRVKRERDSGEQLKAKVQTVTPANQEHNLALKDLGEAFDQLSDDHREVIALVVIQGLDYEATANVLDVKVGTVKSRLSRARRELADTTEVVH